MRTLMRLLTLSLALAFAASADAQRFTDALGRGLVAVPTGSTTSSSSNVITWRRLADEYFDVTYNLYKDGSLLASGLTNTCYNDASSAYTTTSYQVAAVKNGTEQGKCDAVTPWSQYVYKLTVRCATGYIDIPLANVYDRNGTDKTSNYSPNDAEFADLDGDGELEMIIKRLNTIDAGTTDEDGNSKYLYEASSTQFVVIDAYDIDWQTGSASLLWRIDCGPNMVSLNSTEIDIIAYDWDEDGKAEVVLRGADNMIVYGSNGTTQLYTIGDMSVNTRSDYAWAYTASQWTWTHTGSEYLIYMNGQTGAKYQVTDYPLARGSASDWGDSYGHRSSKYFFGAPFLDGRNASLFLARGIYTKHSMIAMDLNKSTHQWSSRWTWACSNSSSPWYGNGYHNFIVADVDEDGRDEIVYGSMVIDDNGCGLSTTGYEHGDAQHVSDFNPYRKGLEYYGCLEDSPFYGSNYRDATTSEVLYKCTASGDDGRCLMANFTDDYPGCLGRSVASNMINSVTATDAGLGGDDYIAYSDLNFRIYWDGDLCSEILNSPGTAKEAKIEKPGTGRLFTSSGCNMNNDSKNNPCFQGDLIGDWREEIAVRCGTNVRIYTSGMATDYSLPSLWFDHQYRQAMVWQMMAYNQPPHTSYFLGELEGYTVAPPPYTMENRTEISNGGTISSSYNSKQVLLAETNDMSVSVSSGAAPWVLIDNAPTWVQGTDVNGTTGTKVSSSTVGATNLPDINTTTYTHTLTGGPFAGSMNLVKQGDGTLVMPSGSHTYTGKTQVWAGTLKCNGSLTSSPVWMNRHTTLISSGGSFGGGIEMLYGSTLIPGGKSNVGTITTPTLTLQYGSRLLIDVDPTTLTADKINIGTLNVNTVSGDAWTNYGPSYLCPVIQFVPKSTLSDATYNLGTLTTLNGSLSDITIEGLSGYSYSVYQSNGSWYLKIGSGSATECAAPVIARTAWSGTSENVYYPTVKATAQTFTYNNQTVTPTLSASFTDLSGNTTQLGGTLYSQNYEDATGTSDWTGKYVTWSLVTDDTDYGNYVKLAQGGGSGPRSGYTRFYTTGSDFYGGAASYSIEFDALFHYTVGNYTGNELTVFGEGASMPASNAMFSSTNYLFKLSGGNNYSTSYTVAGNSTTYSLTDAAWYHYKLDIDKSAMTVTYTISSGSTVVGTGSYSVSSAESLNVQGIEIGLGRMNSYAAIDNIEVYADTDAILAAYTFAEPGTLSVTASYSGCMPTTTSYTSQIGVKISDLGYSTISYPLASLDFTSSGLSMYTLTTNSSETQVAMNAVTAILPQGEAALIKGTAGTIYAGNIVSTATAFSNNSLIANSTDIYGGNGNYYVLNSSDGTVAFYKLSSTGTLTPGKGYITISSASVKEVNDTPTAIEMVEADDNGSDIWYNLAGQRVNRPTKGIFINAKGQKIILK